MDCWTVGCFTLDTVEVSGYDLRNKYGNFAMFNITLYTNIYSFVSPVK